MYHFKYKKELQCSLPFYQVPDLGFSIGHLLNLAELLSKINIYI